MDETTPKIPESYLNRKTEDVIYTLILTCFGFIPYGGVFTPLINETIEPPVFRRFKSFLTSVSLDLIELQNRMDNFDLTELLDDENFITVIIQATQIAIRNHQKEKLEVLRNAVLNSALPINIENDMQLTFLSYIDTFTTVHIQLLKFFHEKKSNEWILDLANTLDHECVIDDGKKYGENYYKKSWILRAFNLWEVLGHEYPLFNKTLPNTTFYEQVIKDLESKGMLIIKNKPIINYSSNHFFNTNLCVFGKLFVEYLTSPTENDLVKK
ncbi:MAG: hypothetical protein F8N39_17925 [Clostridiaceae bacterium]|nr:hypothetical protein [Clostridiaceae bacterium]